MTSMFIVKDTINNKDLNHTLSDKGQDCYEILIDNDPQSSYLCQEEMEDIVREHFVGINSWLKLVEVNLEEVWDVLFKFYFGFRFG